MEIGEKGKQFQENEQKLAEPIPPQDTFKKEELALAQLKNQVANSIKRLEENKDEAKEEKLLIFRRQVEMVQQKKEGLVEEIKLLDQDRVNVELEIQEKKR